MVELGVAWLFLTFAYAFVWLCGSPLGTQLTLSELLAASIPVGAIFSAWIFYLVACALSSLGPITIIISNVILFAIVVERLPRFRSNFPRVITAFRASQGDRLDAALAWGCAAALAIPFWPLFSSRMLPVVNGEVYSGG
jgi:hypothetical protein